MTDETGTSRRTLLRRVAVLGSVAVAGCSGNGDDDSDAPASDGSPAGGSPSADDSTEFGLPSENGTDSSGESTASPTPDAETASSVFEPPGDESETATPDGTATPKEETVAPPGPPGS